MGFFKKKIMRDLSVSLFANLVSLAGSTLMTVLLPKFIGVSEYAYYQLYIFYCSYVGFFAVGQIEGVYLRHGGEYYDKLDKKQISGQFRFFSIFEVFLSVGISLIVFFTSDDFNKTIVLIFFSCCILVYLPRAFLHNLLQTTGRIKEYAQSVMLEKLVHILITVAGIALGQDIFIWFVCSELIGRVCGAIYIFGVCRDIVAKRPTKLSHVIPEIKLNSIAGLPLMISNVASMLIIGVIRQSIEWCWNIETFGKISLTISLSNLLLTFINSVSLVLFPALKRSAPEKLKPIYQIMCTLLTSIIFFAMILYYPVKSILSIWLPQYAESLKYMAILFPICAYESKMSLIINTYMKALRKERTLLYINLVTVGLSICMAALTCFFMHSLDLAIFSIVVSMAFRSIIAERILSKQLLISVLKNNIVELLITAAFIICSWIIGGILGLVLYIICYAIYILINKKDLAYSIKFMKKEIA